MLWKLACRVTSWSTSAGSSRSGIRSTPAAYGNCRASSASCSSLPKLFPTPVHSRGGLQNSPPRSPLPTPYGTFRRTLALTCTGGQSSLRPGMVSGSSSRPFQPCTSIPTPAEQSAKASEEYSVPPGSPHECLVDSANMISSSRSCMPSCRQRSAGGTCGSSNMWFSTLITKSSYVRLRRNAIARALQCPSSAFSLCSQPVSNFPSHLHGSPRNRMRLLTPLLVFNMPVCSSSRHPSHPNPRRRTPRTLV